MMIKIVNRIKLALVSALVAQSAFAGTFIVKYDACGGSGTMPAQNFSGDTLTLNQNRFSKPGYVFVGWSRHAEEKPCYADGACVTKKALTITDPEENEEVILYAAWGREMVGVSPDSIIEKLYPDVLFYTGGADGCWDESSDNILHTASNAGDAWLAVKVQGPGRLAYSAYQTNPGRNTGGMMSCYGFVGGSTGYGGLFVHNAGAQERAVEMSSTVDVAPNVTGLLSFGFYDPGKRSTMCLASLTYVQTCTVTFNAMGGFMSEDSREYTVGTTYGSLPEARKRGVEFAGWYTAATGGDRVTESTKVDRNVTQLFAHWIDPLATYTVTFGKNGGTGGDASVTATYGQEMPKITVPTKSGYKFDGYWTTLKAGGVKYYNADGTSAMDWDKSANTTLWAKWTAAAKTYTVTFGKNGGVGGDVGVTATYGQAMPKITVPTKSGYKFDGYWTTVNAGGVKYYNADGTSAKVWDKTANTTLWAKWTAAAKSCRVTFGKNGGAGGDSWVTVTTGNKPHDVTVPTKASSTFCGYWTTTQPGGKQYIGADGKAVCAWDKTADATLWAKWSNKITFGKNGGTGGDALLTVYQGVMPGNIIPPAKAGYAFDGYWTTVNAGGVQYFSADGSAVRKWDKTSNVTLWAKWKKSAANKAVAAPLAGDGGAFSSAADVWIPGYYRGVFADGSGVFDLLLDKFDDDGVAAAYFAGQTADGSWAGECEATIVDKGLELENGSKRIVVDMADDGCVAAAMP